MDRYKSFEPTREESTFWVLVESGIPAPEGWEAIVTFPLSDGSCGTAVFLSAEAAGPILDSLEANNPERQFGATPHESGWLIEALENRVDINHVVANASSVVLAGGDVAVMDRERFIDLLRAGTVTDFTRRN